MSGELLSNDRLTSVVASWGLGLLALGDSVCMCVCVCVCGGGLSDWVSVPNAR